MHSKLWAVSVIAFATSALAQTNFSTNWNPNGDGCVDSAGFLSCYASQASTANTCISGCASSNKKGSSEYNTCVTNCQKLWYAENVGCWLQSCWNQVYSCGYQLTAMAYFDGNGVAQNDNDIPFYPPPNDVSAGACSCNLGQVYGNLSASTTNQQGSNCVVAADGDNSTLLDCECCGLSWPISNVLNTCPGANLEAYSFTTFISNVAKQLAKSTDKCAILNANISGTCVKQYNFPWLGTTVYNPLSLPTGEPGKAALSNTAGNAFTAFPSNAKTVLTLYPSYTTTVTPASFAPTASADTKSILGTSILGIKSTASSSSTKAASTTAPAATPSATKSSSGIKMAESSLLLPVAAVLVVFGML